MRCGCAGGRRVQRPSSAPDSCGSGVGTRCRPLSDASEHAARARARTHITCIWVALLPPEAFLRCRTPAAWASDARRRCSSRGRADTASSGAAAVIGWKEEVVVDVEEEEGGRGKRRMERAGRRQISNSSKMSNSSKKCQPCLEPGGGKSATVARRLHAKKGSISVGIRIHAQTHAHQDTRGEACQGYDAAAADGNGQGDEHAGCSISLPLPR